MTAFFCPKKAARRLWRRIVQVASFQNMWREFVRRLFVITLSVALTTALVARSVQANGMDVAASTTMAMEPMAMDMPMHGKCDGCAGHEKSNPNGGSQC